MEGRKSMTEQKSWQLARYDEQKKLHRPRIPYGFQAPLNPCSLPPPAWQDLLTRDGRRLAAEREQRGVAVDHSRKAVIFTPDGGIAGYESMSFEQRRAAQTVAARGNK
jgi:hypothetical protein